jgi:hypothetical protein
MLQWHKKDNLSYQVNDEQLNPVLKIVAMIMRNYFDLETS